jgi:hypothetical protein
VPAACCPTRAGNPVSRMSAYPDHYKVLYWKHRIITLGENIRPISKSFPSSVSSLEGIVSALLYLKFLLVNQSFKLRVI